MKRMDTMKIIWILAILMPSMVWSDQTEDQSFDCRTVQCQPIQCPEDSIAVDAHLQPGFNDLGNPDYGINELPLTLDDEMTDAIMDDEDLEDENVVKIEHQNRRHVTPDHFYVEPSEKESNPENRTLVRRSLQYKRRESIKIVPGDYKSFIPDNDHFHNFNQNHHKWRREIVEEEQANETEYATTTAPGDACCPPQKCVCKNSCDRPICSLSQVLHMVRHGHDDRPGECCPLYQCIPEPDCRVNTTNTTWVAPCQKCECLHGHKICHNTCGEEETETRNTCLSTILNQLFLDGQSWLEGECTHCECHDGERKCWTSLCKPLECKHKMRPPGECCPVCAPDSTTISAEEEQDLDMETYPASTSPHSTVGRKFSTPTILVEPPEQDSNSDNDSQTSKDGPRSCIFSESKVDTNTLCLYGIIVVLCITCLIFGGLWCKERSKKKSYGPVPSSDSNLSEPQILTA